MVADEVDVLTRRWDSEQGIHWRSTGDDGYTIESEDNIPAGSTRIQLKLKSDYREFADPDHVKKIAQKVRFSLY
jgi:HSP90 family molecular chaperone